MLAFNLKIDGCAKNPQRSSTTKTCEHIPCGYSVSTIWEFDHIQNKHTLYCGKDCINMFCEILRKHAKNIIGFEKKKMLPLTKEELKSQDHKSMLHSWKKNLKKSL